MENAKNEPKRILIASGEQEIRRLVGTFVGNILGPVLITEVETGEKAVDLALLQASLLTPFNLIITDLRLGRVDEGLSVVSSLQRLGVKVPVIIMTGETGMEISNPPSGNLKGYIKKPIDRLRMRDQLLLAIGITN